MQEVFITDKHQDKLDPWIGGIFAIGSVLFAVASILALAPELAQKTDLSSAAINRIFFAGSIPFTIAAYLQLFQSANKKGYFSTSQALQTKPGIKLFGWSPSDKVWLSSATQFAGTLLFNINTFDATLPGLAVLEEDLLIWVPNFEGSILFLVSGYMAFMTTSHGLWAFRPYDVNWWSAAFNLLGCVGFMASALLSMYLPGAQNPAVINIAVAFTLQGALCFLVGALLMCINWNSPQCPSCQQP